MNKVRVVYIGNKLFKKDTVAGSNAVWRGGRGASRLVAPDVAERLCDFSTVWVDEDTYNKHYAPEDGATTAEEKPGLSSLAVVDTAKISGGTGDAPLAPEQSTNRTVVIQEAIRKLNFNVKDHFTAAGAPKIAAVRTAMDDESVTPQEMNEAFNEIKDEFRA